MAGRHFAGIDYRSGSLFAAAAIPGAILGALNTGYVSRRLFDIMFGVFMLAAAMFLLVRPTVARAEVIRPPVFDHHLTRRLVEADGEHYEYSFNPFLGIVVSILVGYASSFLGIGGGIIHVPALVYFLNFPVHIATATSHFIMVFMAFTGTMVHIVTGTFSHGVHRTISLSVGVVLGAQLGGLVIQPIQGNLDNPWPGSGAGGSRCSNFDNGFGIEVIKQTAMRPKTLSCPLP